MDSSSLQDRYVDVLMERVREDSFPSGELMDRIEDSVRSREQAAEYLDVLYEKVGDSRYPSKQLLNRIERVTNRIA